jgi:hypothetical protein
LTLAILWSVPFGGLFFMGAGWMLATNPDRYQAEVDFRSRAHLTSGIVIEKREKADCHAMSGFGVSCTSRCDLKVKFTSNGKNAEFWDSCYKAANKNYEIPVLHDPTNISKARIDRGDSPESRARDSFIWSIVIGVIGICYLISFAPANNHQKQT